MIAQQIKTIIDKIKLQNTTLPTIMAVSKQQDILAIKAAYDAGIDHFGENIMQDAVPKIIKLKELNIAWHFIGRLQKNKISKIAKYFNWVDSIATANDLTLLNHAARANNKTLNVCIQVGVLATENRRCCLLSQIDALISHANLQDNLKLKGLMSLPPANLNDKDLADYYQKIKKAFDAIKAKHPIDTLSMGMSGDFLLATKHGSSMIRIGKKIFTQYQLDK